MRIHCGALLIVSLLTPLLSACGGDKSDVSTLRDPREPEQPPPPNANFHGVVLDGYLRQAKVWLDLNGDYLAGDDEPAVMSGAGGEYEFTAEQLAGVDDPKLYPLMAYALPCVTQDEDLMNAAVPPATDCASSEPGLVDKAYFLMAPPGSPVISPLTTLVRMQYDLMREEDPEATVEQAHQRARERVGFNNNYLFDYVKSGQYRHHVYAKAFAMALQNMMTEEAQSIDAAQRLDNLDATKVKVMGASLLHNAPKIAYAAAGVMKDIRSTEDFAAYDFSLWKTSLQYENALNDPLSIKQINWYVHPDTESAALEGRNDNDVKLLALAGVQDPQRKHVGRAGLTYDSKGAVAAVRLDGGVDMSRRALSLDAYVSSLTLDPLYTEISPADGEWDVVNALALDRGRWVETFSKVGDAVLSQRTSETVTGQMRPQKDAGAGLVRINSYSTDSATHNQVLVKRAFVFDGDGHLSNDTYDNNLEKLNTQYAYASDGRLNGMRTFTDRPESSCVTEPGCEIATSNFTYDAEGRRLARRYTDIHDPGFEWCEHYVYREDGLLDYVYLERYSVDAEPQGEDGDVIVLVTYEYDALHRLME
ncbi:hypothetical protein [Hahella sp. HN01]|uniref:hypothetical protein n=1 Tax=Hahella sp. HN01 TaxID=2847262 RepID=UPI001C1EBD03|nr:hypothetical protein [Hahella sp. HN01]MBU6950230.1 hypothetical protein [Hahella sp. HN01]